MGYSGGVGACSLCDMLSMRMNGGYGVVMGRHSGHFVLQMWFTSEQDNAKATTQLCVSAQLMILLFVAILASQ